MTTEFAGRCAWNKLGSVSDCSRSTWVDEEAYGYEKKHDQDANDDEGAASLSLGGTLLLEDERPNQQVRQMRARTWRAGLSEQAPYDARTKQPDDCCGKEVPVGEKPSAHATNLCGSEA